MTIQLNNIKQKQKGAVLIIALIMLLILTILGVAVMESSVLQERMAGNNLDRNRAFQAAEAGLRSGEQWLAGLVEQPIPVNGYTPNRVAQLGTVGANANWWRNANDAWWLANGRDTNLTLEGASNNPRYVIEEYDEVCDNAGDPSLRICKLIYRVTAIGWGGRNSSVLLQSLYARRY